MMIRDLASDADYEACLALQRETWGGDFRELVPQAIFQIAQKVGGVAMGAFDDGGLAGFVFGLTGPRGGTLAHWSHMLAVRADRRDRGLGRRLKLAQRDRLLGMGVARMLWTFDPLVARNAHLNLDRLGARVVEYVENMYGEHPMSTADAVIGSDRFVVEWRLDREPPGAAPRAAPDAPTVGPDTTSLPEGSTVLIAVPRDIQTLKQRDPSRARAYRAATRAAFAYYLGHGYAVDGIAAADRDAPRYVLRRV